MTLYLLFQHLADAVLAYLLHGRVPELIQRLAPIRTAVGHRLHLIDPSRDVNKKSLNQDVSEVWRGGTDGVQDGGEIACWVLLRVEGFHVGIMRCRLRFALLNFLFQDDVLLLE